MSLPPLHHPAAELVDDELRSCAKFLTGLIDGVAAGMEQHPDTENWIARFQVAGRLSEPQAEVRLLWELVLGILAADCEPEHYPTLKELVTSDICMAVLDEGRMQIKELAEALSIQPTNRLTRLWQRMRPEAGRYDHHYEARQAERAEHQV